MTRGQVIDLDGMEKFAFTIRTKKKEFPELTWLAASFDEQEEWVSAIESHIKSVSLGHIFPDGNSSPDLGSPSEIAADKQGWLGLEGKNAVKTGEWATKYVSISTVGFSWDDGEAEVDSASTPLGDIRLRLVAESAESYGAWIVALKWLEGGCRGRPPRDDPHMCAPTTFFAAPRLRL